VWEEYKPVYGFNVGGDRHLNITNRCTLQCAHCPKFHGDWTFEGYDLRLMREPTVSELVDAVGNPALWNEVVFSGYGEPTLRLYDVLEISRRIHERGGRVRLETDGLANVFFGRDITPDLEGNIDTLVVALKAQDSQTYERLCRPKVRNAHQAVLDFVRRARAFVPEVILTVLSNHDEVDIEACHNIARNLNVGFSTKTSCQVC
jgi:TatD family-associated radical SAM protein